MLHVFLECFRKMCFFLGQCWICWMCWMPLEFTDSFWMRPISPKNIQHIQHIQHFPRKKLIFWEILSNTFNIFNISAEGSTCFKKMLLSALMSSGNWGVQKGSVSSKTFNLFNIFNISPEFWKRHLNIFNIFRRNKPILGKMFLSAVMLNVGSLPGNWGWVGGCGLGGAGLQRLSRNSRKIERDIQRDMRAHTHSVSHTQVQDGRQLERKKKINWECKGLSWREVGVRDS